MNVYDDIIYFSEQILLGLLLARIAIYSQKTTSNYYCGIVSSIIWIHLAISDQCESNRDSLVDSTQLIVRSPDWLIPAGLWLITHVWLSFQRFHRVYLERIQRRYQPVAISVEV